MAYFDADGKRYHPFGKGSGERIVRDFGLPNLCRFPIEAELSAAGDGGRPLVVSNPTSATANAFMDLGAAVVREVAKLSMVGKASARSVPPPTSRGKEIQWPCIVALLPLMPCLLCTHHADCHTLAVLLSDSIHSRLSSLRRSLPRNFPRQIHWHQFPYGTLISPCL